MNENERKERFIFFESYGKVFLSPKRLLEKLLEVIEDLKGLIENNDGKDIYGFRPRFSLVPIYLDQEDEMGLDLLKRVLREDENK